MKIAAHLPRALWLVALLFLIGGISSAVNVVIGALHHTVQLDFGVLGIFVCLGLLRLSSSWRRCALILVYFGLIFTAIAGFFSMFSGSFWGTLVSIIWFGIALIQWSVLKRPDVEALFEQRSLAGRLA